MRIWGLLGAALLIAAPAMARDVAVIVDNQSYRQHQAHRDGIQSQVVAQAARRAGYDVYQLRNATADQLWNALTIRYADMDDADRLVVILSGHMVTDGWDTFLLSQDAGRNSNLFMMTAHGLRIGSMLKLLETKPGDGFLFLAPGEPSGVGAGFEQGVGFAEIPQGVAVVEGDGADLTDFLANSFFQGEPVGLALGRYDGLEGDGYLPRRTAAAPVDDQAAREAAQREARAADARAWRQARDQDTVASYNAYLREYPNGQFALAAQARLQTVQRSPEELAAAVEADLGLSREDRRRIQRNLAILDYDPRGIDGIFGPGTRAAIQSWQAAEQLESNGFLTGNQILRLDTAAARRQAELEAEAKRQQEERDRNDRAYWRATGRGNSEDGLRQYLTRYPEGLFSDIARARVAEYEASRRDQISQRDQQDWQAVSEVDTIPAYRQYLDRHPQGAYAEAARTRIQELRGVRADRDAINAAQAQEAQVVANPITKLLVERRLSQLGLNPGVVDGTFDDNTRRAIRQYQSARNIQATGYVNQRTLVRMLAGN
ncbi:MAG: peptidoglycan-binding domain-containing protein [Pseudomonadota bacterium]